MLIAKKQSEAQVYPTRFINIRGRIGPQILKMVVGMRGVARAAAMEKHSNRFSRQGAAIAQQQVASSSSGSDSSDTDSDSSDDEIDFSQLQFHSENQDILSLAEEFVASFRASSRHSAHGYPAPTHIRRGLWIMHQCDDAKKRPRYI